MTNKIYAEVLEAGALKQFESALAQPFAVRGALMPDAHQGYSLPIGAVVATKDFILPAWVGYDIGCGMCAVEVTGITPKQVLEDKEYIFDRIYDEIPVGFNKNEDGTKYSTGGLTDIGIEIAEQRGYQKALGSLGGGNHFIEIGHDEEGKVWIVTHSGSRGVGWNIAKHYMKLAHPEGKAVDGHFGFHTDSQEGLDYIQDLNWCLMYALANRQEIVNRVIGILEEVVDGEVDMGQFINRNHNHAEYNIDEDLWVHRKGATHAELGMMGVIPGNMRDGSFIVKGKGNPDSLYSSSHGAGRVLGRKEAKRKLKLKDFQETMTEVYAKVDKTTLDESPEAYKNIFDVMELQKDLVEVVAHVKPLVNIKG